MTTKEILLELEKFGDPQTKKTLMTHGAKEPLFGVKVEHLKTILKKTKKNHELALELYATGNSDAMYLAGLMADETKMTEAHLNEWVKNAYWSYLNEYTVPWVASETAFGFDLGLKWIESDEPLTAGAGWSTLSSVAALKPDKELDIQKYSELLDYIEKNISNAENRVKLKMNAFLIAIGSFVEELSPKAMTISARIGKIHVDMNGTACKVPFAPNYINKVIARCGLGKKRKSARC